MYITRRLDKGTREVSIILYYNRILVVLLRLYTLLLIYNSYIYNYSLILVIKYYLAYTNILFKKEKKVNNYRGLLKRIIN